MRALLEAKNNNNNKKNRNPDAENPDDAMSTPFDKLESHFVDGDQPIPAAVVAPPRLASRLLFFALGLTTLVAWNSMLSALYSFDCALKSLNFRIDNVMTFGFAVLTTLFMFCNSVWGDRFSFKKRIVAGFIGFAVQLATLWPAAYLTTPALGFTLTMIGIAFMAGSDGISETTTYSMAPVYRNLEVRRALAALPESERAATASRVTADNPYGSSTQAGQAFAGVLVSVIYLVCIALFPNPTDLMNRGVYVYFTISAAWCLLMAAISFKVVPHRADTIEGESVTPKRLISFRVKLRAMVAVWPLMLTLVFTYTASLIVFPATLLRLTPQTVSPTYFVQILIVTWNCGDFFGKLALGSLVLKLFSEETKRSRMFRYVLLAVCIIRGGVLCGLFMGIVKNTITLSDAGVILLTSVGCGLTNGTFSVIAMELIPPCAVAELAGPQAALLGRASGDKEEMDADGISEAAGATSILALLTGINVGLLVALAVYNVSPC